MPAHGGPVKLARPYASQEFEIVDEDEQRRQRHLAQSKLGLKRLRR